MKKITLDLGFWQFTVSVKIPKSFTDIIAHFTLHFIIGLINPSWSIVWAVATEFRDGEQGHLEDWKEGFNIFPDLTIRLLGVWAAIEIGVML